MYDPNVVGSMDAVVAPPYDVISPEESQALRAAHPANTVRLILPRGETPYAEADKRLKTWLDEGALRRMESPGLFVYEQIFQYAGRRYCRSGVIARLRLEDAADGTTYGHETTLSGPKADRMRLLQAVKTNLSPVFCLVPDRKGLFKHLIRRGGEGEARLTASFEGVQNQIFPITDAEEIKAIRDVLANEPVYIADGHHRYETALSYHIQTAGRVEADGPTAYVMAMLVPMTDPGLVVLPTHRIVKTADITGAQLIEKLQEKFVVERVPDDSAEFAGLAARLATVGARPAFGVHTVQGTWLAVLRDEADLTGRVPGKSADWHDLDVAVLHLAVIDEMLGIPFDRLADASELVYTRDAARLRGEVDRNEALVGFLLRSTPVEALKAVGRHRELMPPKSTFFYPKLLTGLVFNVLDEE